MDVRWMRRALDLARATTALTSPNPRVGCVLVRDGNVIGEGVHLYDHRDHAEIAALKNTAERGLSPAMATAYVTLEPCSHQGRTGPCADALIAAGVARVVIGTVDPNPRVSGRGITRLRAAGIDVAMDVCKEQARELIEAFASFIRHRVPFVTLKAALSADGKLAPPPETRLPNQPFWLTGPTARTEVQRMRHASDAILTGVGTVLADNPKLTDRTGLPRRRSLLRIVLDTHLRTPPNSNMVSGARGDLLLLCGTESPEERYKALKNAGAEVMMLPKDKEVVNLAAVLGTLADREIVSLLLECGSVLNGAFLRQDLVDKAVLFYAERELGERAVSFADGLPSPFLFEQTLHRVTRTSLGLDACVTGYLRDPAALFPVP